MLVVDLHCENGHLFEGWFASGDELSSQQARGLLSCPVCSSHEVVRRPSAARLNVSPQHERQHERQVETRREPQAEVSAAAMQAMYLKAVRHVLDHTDDVGERFAEEARSMHRGDVPERPIRGQADQEALAELKEEGIDVMSMPIPAALKGPLQ